MILMMMISIKLITPPASKADMRPYTKWKNLHVKMQRDTKTSEGASSPTNCKYILFTSTEN